jgi:hypothetical protein
MVYREAVGNDLEVTASVGDVLTHRPVVVRAADNRAEFTVRGGRGYVPLTVTGLTTCRAPRLEWLSPDGQWAAVDQAVHGHDFWQTDYHVQARTWEITYTVPADTADDLRTARSFRFRVGP